MTPDDQDLIDRRRRSRATIFALLLGALVILIFAVSITRIRQGMPEGARAVTDKGPSQMPRRSPIP